MYDLSTVQSVDSLEVLRVLPLMTGDMLRSATDSKALLGKGSQFSVCFGTGGTTGEMKNCYRLVHDALSIVV